MEYYRNISGTSGVNAYQTGNDNIIVQFKDGGTYLYNYASAGRENIEKMKRLAVAGSGLNSFINAYVKKGYASKIR